MNSFNFLLKLLEGENPPDLVTQMETRPKPAIENNQESLEMQSKQEPELESKFEQRLLNPSKINTNGNGNRNSTAFNEKFDIRQDIALVSSIKVKLEKAGLLTPVKDQDKVIQFQRLAEILQTGLQDKLAAAAEANFNNERQRLLAVVDQMRQAPDVATLFTATVAEVRKH